MRQVPVKYLIVGNGRVARHFSFYFSQAKLPYRRWWRRLPLSLLKKFLIDSTHVLLLITDKEIEIFAEKYLSQHRGIHIHFSGALASKKVVGAHPLQTFSNNIYKLENYQTIPFVIDHDAPDFSQLLPGLKNQHVRLNKKDKAKYHALCVLGGNFSCMLWQKAIADMEKELKLPKDVLFPYMHQSIINLMADPKNALTGPLVRGDKKTIKNNLDALEGDPFQDVYKSFVKCYEKLKSENTK